MRMDSRLGVSSAAQRAYLVAGVAVLAAYGVRYLAQPVVGDNHPYSLFFPVVLVCAYVFGRGPAAFAAILAAVLAYWTFVEPRFGAAVHLATLAPLALFLSTAGVAIFLITGLTSALNALARDQGRLHAAADAHAGLFRDLQSRLGHHMTLLVGVLSLQARGEPDPEILALLRKAGERSQLLARAYRELAGDGVAEIDFAAFAGSLARMTCADAGQPLDRIAVDDAPLPVPIEVATSLGVALAECLAWILRQQPSGRTTVALTLDDGEVRLRISHNGETEGAAVALAPALMFRAMVEQLGAEVRVASEGPEAPGLDIAVPLPAKPRRDAPRDVTLH